MRILITGKTSYVGVSLQRWLSQWPDKYIIDTIDVRTEEWKKTDFSIYDVLFHVAAVVHKKEKSQSKEVYYKVNRDLTIELAMKARQSGIKHFIFMSSMSVYGIEGKIVQKIAIDQETPCNPANFYGNSKLAAEHGLRKLECPDLNIAIIRAPMVYGPDCPGNYRLLRKIVLKTKIVPEIKNIRSMIFINNLCEFIRLVIDQKQSGTFLPQNNEYVSTDELMELIATNNGKKIKRSKVLGLFFQIFGDYLRYIRKSFGNLYYDKNQFQTSKFQYCLTGFEESIKLTESNWVKGER